MHQPLAPVVDPPRGLIVLGGSAGSVQAITTVVASLPADLPAAVLVVVHVPADARSALPQLLARAGRLDARHAAGDEPLAAGTILVAPPDRHLLVRDGHVELSRGPRENRHRPSIDATFRSAAEWYGDRVVAVVLSGALSDGTAGLRAVALAGGAAIVQDPAEAQFTGMPTSALSLTDATVLPVQEIAGRLEAIVRGWSPAGTLALDPDGSGDRQRAEEASVGSTRLQPSAMGCPDCGGVLQERPDATGFVCRVGHGYGPEDLSSAQRESIELALWSAIRALEENQELNDRLATRAGAAGMTAANQQFTARAAEAAEHVTVLRTLVDAPARGHDAAGQAMGFSMAAHSTSTPSGSTIGPRSVTRNPNRS